MSERQPQPVNHAKVFKIGLYFYCFQAILPCRLLLTAFYVRKTIACALPSVDNLSLSLSLFLSFSLSLSLWRGFHLAILITLIV